MSEAGLLTNVRWEWDGTEVSVLAPLGATEVTVEDTSKVAVDDVVWIAGTGPYRILDIDGGVLTLDTPLVEEMEVDESVVPDTGGGPARIFVAEVVLSDAAGPVEIMLPPRGLLVTPEGEYDPPKAVIVADDYESFELVGDYPEVDMGLIVTPDGTPPATGGQLQDAVDLINADIQSTVDLVNAGDSANAQAIDDAVADFNAGLATKSKHTLSPDAPTVNDANNVGDVWERHKAGDMTKIIGRWRGQGGTAGAYSWLVMDLDATYIPLLDIGSGTFGDLDGGRILADSIGTDKLLVSDFTNFCTDPRCTGFGWTFDGGASINGTTANSQGVTDGVLLHPASGVTSNCYGEMFDLPAPTNPGSVGGGIYLNVEFDSLREASANGSWRVKMEWYSVGGSLLSSTDAVTGGSTDTNGSWVRRSGNVTAPSGAVRGRIVTQRHTGTTVGTYKFDNFNVRRRFGGELVVDGSILARHVTADMVEGLLVTGRVLQTNANGPAYGTTPTGIKISTNGLIGYDSGGNVKTVLSPTTGLFEMVGGNIVSSTYTNGQVSIISDRVKVGSGTGTTGYVQLDATQRNGGAGIYYPTVRFVEGSSYGSTVRDIYLAGDTLRIEGPVTLEGAAADRKIYLDQIDFQFASLTGAKLSGMGKPVSRWDFGNYDSASQGNTNASGDVTFNHDLQVVPLIVVFGGNTTAGNRGYHVVSKSSSSITVRVKADDGTAVASAAVNFFWWAVAA